MSDNGADKADNGGTPVGVNHIVLNVRDIEQAHGLRAARVAFDSWRRASLEGAALLRRLNIKCGIEAVIPLIVAVRDDEKTWNK